MKANYKNFFRQNPLLRVVIPFIAGIFCVPGKENYVNNIHIFLLFFLYICYLISVLFLYKFYKYKYRWINGLIAVIFFFISGYVLTLFTFENYDINHFSHKLKSKEIFIIEVQDTKNVSKDRIKAESKVLYITDNNKWEKVKGNIIINFIVDTNEVNHKISYGNRFIVYCKPYEIKDPTNPGEFNYRDFLVKKRIFHQAKAKVGNYKFIGNNRFSLRGNALKIRDNLLDILSNTGLKGQEYAVSSALVLGYTDEIDNETLKQYTGSGAMHILSVSGMHVGVVFLVISFIVSLLFPKGRFEKLKTIILTGSIWFYALLTGLSPSVFRAAAMLSFIVIGNALSRKSSIYNTLCASALLILISNTQLIKNIGFQLSYIAVLGIVIFYEPIRKLWQPKFKIFNKIWELVAVSISAQIATGALSAFYFNQFPNYFILSNIVAGPLSGLVIYAASIVLLLSPLKQIAKILSKILGFLVMFLNKSLAYIESLPYSVSKGININFTQCLMIYGIIIFLYLMINTRKKIYVWYSGGLILILCLFSLIKDININKKDLCIVFNNYQGSAIGFYKGKNAAVIVDTFLVNKSMESSMPSVWEKAYHGLKNTTVIPWETKYLNYYNGKLIKEGPLIKYNNKTILIIDKYIFINNKPKYKYKVDYLIIKKNNKMNEAGQVLNLVEPNTVILDGTLPVWSTKNWEKQCSLQNINLYNVKTKGAFIIDFK